MFTKAIRYLKRILGHKVQYQLSSPQAQYERINGFSNLYIGWGCEDTDFLTRIRTRGLLVVSKGVQRIVFKGGPGVELFF